MRRPDWTFWKEGKMTPLFREPFPTRPRASIATLGMLVFLLVLLMLAAAVRPAHGAPPDFLAPFTGLPPLSNQHIDTGAARSALGRVFSPCGRDPANPLFQSLHLGDKRKSHVVHPALLGRVHGPRNDRHTMSQGDGRQLRGVPGRHVHPDRKSALGRAPRPAGQILGEEARGVIETCAHVPAAERHDLLGSIEHMRRDRL